MNEKTEIVTQTFSQQIYERLRNAILEGEYRYGDTINAKVVSNELGVSMMPVREALKHLEQAGLVEIRPRSMCLVKTPSKNTIRSAIQMRQLLEDFCVKQIYLTIEPEKLSVLKEINDNMAKALLDDDIKSFIRNDWRFHCELCNLAENEFVSSCYPELYIRVNMSTLYEMSSPDGRLQDFLDDHIRLVDALEKHSVEAIDIINSHLANSMQNILGGEAFNRLQA